MSEAQAVCPELKRPSLLGCKEGLSLFEDKFVSTSPLYIKDFDKSAGCKKETHYCQNKLYLFVHFLHLLRKDLVIVTKNILQR